MQLSINIALELCRFKPCHVYQLLKPSQALHLNVLDMEQNTLAGQTRNSMCKLNRYLLKFQSILFRL